MSVLDTLGVLRLLKGQEDQKRTREDEQTRSLLKYRRVFNTPDGREVLAEILFRLGYGRQLVDEADRVRYNEAIFLLSRMGIAPAGEKLTELLLSLPYEQGTTQSTEEETG